jgi:hypothetical protein
LATPAETGMCKKPRLVMSAYIMDIGCLEAAQPMTDDGYSSPRYVRLDLPRQQRKRRGRQSRQI